MNRLRDVVDQTREEGDLEVLVEIQELDVCDSVRAHRSISQCDLAVGKRAVCLSLERSNRWWSRGTETASEEGRAQQDLIYDGEHGETFDRTLSALSKWTGA